MDATLWSTIVFTVLIVVVPQLVAAYFSAPGKPKTDAKERRSGKSMPAARKAAR